MNEAEAGMSAAWQAFINEPASYVDDSRLPAALGGEIGADLAQRLRGCERVGTRLSALIVQRHGLSENVSADGMAAEDLKIAVAPSDALRQIVLRAGAVLWSSAIANAVRGREAAAIDAAIGDGVRSFAIAHRAPGGVDKVLEPFDTLRERIMADGWRCYAGWCDAMPVAIGERARLKMPAEADAATAPASLYTEVGPAVIRLAAA
jgi:hypothetical protein